MIVCFEIQTSLIKQHSKFEPYRRTPVIELIWWSSQFLYLKPVYGMDGHNKIGGGVQRLKN
jgi:hypothetical protein